MAQPTPVDPADRDIAITPNDTAVISPIPDAICALVAGNVTVRLQRSTADTVYYLNAGVPLPIRPQFIRATGTAATGIVGMFNQGH